MPTYLYNPKISATMLSVSFTRPQKVSTLGSPLTFQKMWPISPLHTKSSMPGFEFQASLTLSNMKNSSATA